MDAATIWEVALAVLASLGGGAILVLAMSAWLGKVWATRFMEREKAEHTRTLEELRSKFLRETESYRVQLKKSEFLFQKQFEAACAVVALKRRILPRHSHPFMEWHDACEQIAHSFEKIEMWLGDFLECHAAVLPKEVTSLIVSCIADVGTYKFEARSDDVSYEAIEAAKQLYETLEKVEQNLISLVHDQTSL